MEMAPAVSSLTYARMAISFNGSGVMATKSTLTKITIMPRKFGIQ